ncbi:TetR/AcrR family transcriptional regulator [Jiangella alkaliphila]|uniref:DNA-binding transcriptional regulator, AcrR family n=1 Tax=Jiangella alkaliphila TaxID=419479 RepID=A0A1H2HZ12_9ACTN|nr:TetR/AcrR family transcriptional regulator [Jiangella alkaliphila]SDU37044.1 DNA-binding transcriptional regulator, AcrR family [Jiangella alkaliphila]
MARRRVPPARSGDDRDVRRAILTATKDLLDERRFDELSVADVLQAAGVARGSFYFYFEGKHDVLAELIREAVGVTSEMADPWLEHPPGADPEPGVRAGIEGGATFWAEHAALLRAVVENWHSDPRLRALWLELMGSYTAITEARIRADQERGLTPSSVDPHDLAATLTWLGERLYYLAALDVEPFGDRKRLADVLTHVWMSALYSRPAT